MTFSPHNSSISPKQPSQITDHARNGQRQNSFIIEVIKQGSQYAETIGHLPLKLNNRYRHLFEVKKITNEPLSEDAAATVEGTLASLLNKPLPDMSLERSYVARGKALKALKSISKEDTGGKFIFPSWEMLQESLHDEDCQGLHRWFYDQLATYNFNFNVSAKQLVHFIQIAVQFVECGFEKEAVWKELSSRINFPKQHQDALDYLCGERQKEDALAALLSDASIK